MRPLAQFVSLISLSMVTFPCLLSLAGLMPIATVQWLAFLGTVGWFSATPLWMGRAEPSNTEPTM